MNVISGQGKGWQRQANLRLNVNLLRPFRHSVGVPGGAIQTSWIEYGPRRLHPKLQFLPHQLATFLVENLHEQLRLPPPDRLRSEHYYTDEKGQNWGVPALSQLLRDVLVADTDGTQIACFGGVQMESELFQGVMNLRVRPFDKHYGRFRNVSLNFACISHFTLCTSYIFAMLHLLKLKHRMLFAFPGVFCNDSSISILSGRLQRF